MRRLLFLVLQSYLVWGQQKCCNEISGLCFDRNPPFDHLPLPECPDEIDIRMNVFTRSNQNVGQSIDRDSIPPAWQAGRRTHVIVHGWLGSQDNNWMHEMKDAALDEGDYNIILVGWEESSQQIWYPASASDTRSVGSHIAAVFDNLIDSGGADPDEFYCAGHSLGSHVCGHTGAYSQSLFGFTIGRITGMDPAGPLFEGKDWEVGLNPDCASFVDIMHTHGEPNVIMNLGTMKVLGHVDFYPNAGGTQPGCILDPLSEEEEVGTTDVKQDLTPACSHMRALNYYLESITDDCFLSRERCTDPDNLPGSCTDFGEPIQAMGFHADDSDYMSSGIFYLETNSASPFCEG